MTNAQLKAFPAASPDIDLHQRRPPLKGRLTFYTVWEDISRTTYCMAASTPNQSTACNSVKHGKGWQLNPMNQEPVITSPIFQVKDKRAADSCSVFVERL